MADEKIIGFDDEAFNILSRQVKAQEEKNRIEQQSLNVLKRKERISTDILERYAKLNEQIEHLPSTTEFILSRLAAIETTLNDSRSSITTELKSYAAIIREIAEELSNRFDLFEIELSRRIGRLEDIQTARLKSDVIDPADAAKWLSGLSIERKRRELKQQYLNLQEFREQASKHGINIPINLVNEIAYAESRIAELEQDLNAKHT